MTVVPLRRRLLLAGMAMAGGIARGEANALPQISLADVGGAPGNADAAPVFRAALERLPRRGGAVLHVPAGVWRFAANSDVAVLVQDFEALRIDGPGALLLFNGRIRPFVFDRCQNPVVHGLRIDWERAPFSQGDVARITPDHREAEILIDPSYPVDGSEPISALGSYDRASGLMARNAVDAYDLVSAVQLAGRQRLVLSFNRPIPLAVGATVVLRHATYGANAFSFRDCKEIVLEDVTVHSAPGMAVFADRCSGLIARRLNVIPPRGSGRLMTTTADGLHCRLCGGVIVVEDCMIARSGDDCVNVHGTYVTIVKHGDARTLTVAAPESLLASPANSTAIGETVEIVAARSLQTLDCERIVSITADTPDQTMLHLDHDLPPGMQDGDYLGVAPMPTSLRVTGCVFPGNRARGVLAHRDVVIERCQFHGQSAEAILLLPDARFKEGPAADRVEIRDCRFVDALRLGGPGGVIRVDVGVRPSIAGSPRVDIAGSPLVNGSIAIEANQFAACQTPAVVARSVSRLTITANHIEAGAGVAILLEDVASAAITGNTAVPAALVLVQSAATKITTAGNHGLILPHRLA